MLFFFSQDNLISEILNESLIKTLENDIELNQNLNYLQLWVWLAKALLLREHKLYEHFINKLIDWLNNENLTDKCSKAFYVLLNDYNTVLSREKTNANVKLFYKQRFFNFVIQKLKDNFNSNENQSKFY